MAEGKWALDLRPEMPQEEAARHVLQARLEAVRGQLARATDGAARDAEAVHQLRVATRRADAALRLFRDCLPRRAYRAARERLRSARRAAGAARDWDVFLLALRARLAEARPEEAAGVDLLIAYALGRRDAAQAALDALAPAHPDDFGDLIAATVEAVRPPREPGLERLQDMARVTLAGLLGPFDLAAAGDLKNYEHLHQVRILGKRLRYAMEVLACCFAPRLREGLYPMVEEMQETLGRANDSHVAIGRLAALRERLRDWPETWGRVKGGVEGLLRFHQRRLPQERRRFLRWLEGWREAEPAAVLGEPAGG